LGARSINWVHIFSWGVKWCEVYMKFESRWSPDFFRLLLSNCLNWKINCDDHSSLSSTTAVHIWIISYKLHIIQVSGRNTILPLKYNVSLLFLKIGSLETDTEKPNCFNSFCF